MATQDEQAKPHEEHQYLDLIRHVIQHGQHRPDRTGTGTRSCFAPPQLRFSLADATLPLITTKKVHTKAIIHELLWFIRGATSTAELRAAGVRIWEPNGSRAYLDSVGLSQYAEGTLGPIYGFQWRHFGAAYQGPDHDYSGQGVDQLRKVIEAIVERPTDRRMILTAWNPAALHEMALPPCHMMCQFYVTLPDEAHPKPRLSAILYQRSADLGLGLPFNITSYALLVHMIAHVTQTEPFELVIQLGDAHVYANHIQPLSEVQLCRSPKAFPTVKLSAAVTDIDGFTFDDVQIVDYSPHPRIEMEMSV
ncbi:thymidylate synthase [Puccinia triticina 1-1 BBBD Race 1]|uniref:thymidylate synthase n=1 Tax=Puccinia triticina (isolate 1-1 / race 1 (BBBD)) TaxID=630390 RepID=A0A0C4ERQ4_PUCT1|nr:thymidylate synthase [Puccinia triticina 1-1 BBBD Race 1]